MLALFRSNQIVTILLLALYVVLTHAAALIGFVTPAPTSEIGGDTLLYRAWFGWTVDHTKTSAFVAVILVLIQAISVNKIADDFKLLNDRSWLTGLSYALVTACIPDFLFVTPALVAATFIPWTLSCIFGSYQNTQASGLIFNAAFWLMVACFFYPPAIFLLIAAFAGVSVVRSFRVREHAIFTVGALVPVFLGWLVWFWLDQGALFRAEIIGRPWGIYRFNTEFSLLSILKWGIMGFLLMVILFNSLSSSRKLIQAQKCITCLYWFLVVGGFSILLKSDPTKSHLLIIMAPIAIFLSLTFSGIRNKMIAEVLHLTLLGSIFFIQFFPSI